MWSTAGLLRREGERAAPADERGRRSRIRVEIEMRKVSANEWMTLDGVVQAPAYTDEDPSGGIEHGSWHTRYFDDLSMGLGGGERVGISG
jgi:hypothetical protein